MKTEEEKRFLKKEYSKVYSRKNKEKIYLAVKLWRKNNPDKYKAQIRKQYHKDKAKNKERKKIYVKANKAKVYQLKLAGNKRRYKANLQFRIRSKIRTIINNYIKSKDASFFIDLIGCDIHTLKVHIASKFKPGMTWSNRGRLTWHIDHIIPCLAFDLTDPEQQKLCFHYTNTQPLWAEENVAKGIKKPTNL